jgi:4,5-DOPA dioxygenase extradiol
MAGGFQKMPAVFVSHGSPMVALQRGAYQDALAEFGRGLRPKAILVVWAHWGSGTTVAIAGDKQHRTVHDFGGFPSELYELTYDAPGSPEVSAEVEKILRDAGLETATTQGRGLDHGAWVPLRFLYPEADVPVVAVSVPLRLSAEELYRVGEALSPLRSQGVMVVGDGGIAHNLRLGAFRRPLPWIRGRRNSTVGLLRPRRAGT